MQQIYRRTPMPKSNFDKVANNFIEITLRHGCSPVNFLHIFRKSFPRTTSGGLLLNAQSFLLALYLSGLKFLNNAACFRGTCFRIIKQSSGITIKIQLKYSLQGSICFFSTIPVIKPIMFSHNASFQKRLKVVVSTIFLKKINFSQKKFFGLKATSYI